VPGLSANLASDCYNLNTNLNKDYFEGTSKSSDSGTSEITCTSVGMRLACGSVKAASGKEGSGGKASGIQDGSKASGATGDDSSDLASLANLAKDISAQEAQAAKESAALQAAISEGRVSSTAPINHQNGAMAEELGWQSALADGEVGIQGPSKITQTGPDYITYDPDTETINVWDAKYSSSGKFPSSLSPSKLASWMQQVDAAVNEYNGPEAAQAQDALVNGQVSGGIFTYGPK
jgi:hypothetical protein